MVLGWSRFSWVVQYRQKCPQPEVYPCLYGRNCGVFLYLRNIHISLHLKEVAICEHATAEELYNVLVVCDWLVGWLIVLLGLFFVLVVVDFCTAQEQLKYHCALTQFCTEFQNIAPYRLLWRTLTLFQRKLVQPSKRAVPFRKTRMKQIHTVTFFL